MTLRTLLDDCVHFDAEYAAGLSNHLPMALVALHRLGASDARLESFAASYRVHLAPAPGAAQWPAGDAWASQFGHVDAWPAYRALFAEWLYREDPDSVLAQALPVLMQGCAAAAFHGLIRTAYAVGSGHGGELADALAYWACRHLRLEVPPRARAASAPGATDDPALAIQGLRQALRGWRAEGRLISQRMQQAVVQPAFAAQVGRLQVTAHGLPALARLAQALYADGGDFTVLHMATGCHALRLLMPFIDAPLQALQSFWVACAAAAAGLPDTAFAVAPMPAALPGWPEIVQRAIASDDAHVIKLVYSAREEHAHYGWDICRRAAARAVMRG